MTFASADLHAIINVLKPPHYKIFAGTGHRPEKLGGYNPTTDDRLLALASWHLEQHPCHAVISGMAAGWDQALAEAAIQHQIPLIAAVPFKGQEERWSVAARHRYLGLLSQAAHIEIIDGDVRDETEARRAFDKRNRWMVDRCTHLVTLWDGSNGGTANCIRYATRGERPPKFYDLWSYWESGKWS